MSARDDIESWHLPHMGNAANDDREPAASAWAGAAALANARNDVRPKIITTGYNSAVKTISTTAKVAM